MACRVWDSQGLGWSESEPWASTSTLQRTLGALHALASKDLLLRNWSPQGVLKGLLFVYWGG